MIFDLYAVVRNLSVKRANNLIGSVFRWLLFLPHLRLKSLSSDKLKLLDDESNVSCFLYLRLFFFLSLFFLIDLLEFLSFDGLYLFDDESDDDGSGSGSPGTCNFTFCSGNSVGSVSCVGSGVFFGLELSLLVTFFCWLRSYKEDLSPKLVDS